MSNEPDLEARAITPDRGRRAAAAGTELTSAGPGIAAGGLARTPSRTPRGRMPRIGASGPHRPEALTSRSCAGPRWHAGPVQKDALVLRAGPRLIVSQLCIGDPRVTLGRDRSTGAPHDRHRVAHVRRATGRCNRSCNRSTVSLLPWLDCVFVGQVHDTRSCEDKAHAPPVAVLDRTTT